MKKGTSPIYRLVEGPLGIEFDYKNATIQFFSSGRGEIFANQRRSRPPIEVVPQTFRHPLTDTGWFGGIWSRIVQDRDLLSLYEYTFANSFWADINVELAAPLTDPVHNGVPLRLRRGTRAEMKTRMIEAVVASRSLKELEKRPIWSRLTSTALVTIEAGTLQWGPRVEMAMDDIKDPTLLHLLQLIAAEYLPVGQGRRYSGHVKLAPMEELVRFPTAVRRDDIETLSGRERLMARHSLARWLREVDRAPQNLIGNWLDLDLVPVTDEDEEAAGGTAQERELIYG